MCVCVTFVVFTDCESCTRSISTNPGSMETGEYGLTRWTCFVARRLEVVAVAGLLWISWCVWGAAGFSRVLFSFNFPFFFDRTRPAASMRPPCLIYISTSSDNEAVRSRGQGLVSTREYRPTVFYSIFCVVRKTDTSVQGAVHPWFVPTQDANRANLPLLAVLQAEGKVLLVNTHG